MIILPMQSMGGHISNKTALSMLIVFNSIFFVSFFVLYYLFTKDSFKGTFWEWSWDIDYFLKDPKTNAGLGFIFLWIPLFCMDGIAGLVFLIQLVEKIIYKKNN